MPAPEAVPARAGGRPAYILLVHHRPVQVARLVSSLTTPDARFLVHVDRRAPAGVAAALAEQLGDRDDVSLMPRHACVWGGFGVVRATLDALAALPERHPEYTHAVLLSGQDYPLEPPAAIERRLAALGSRSAMDIAALPSDRWSGHGLDRVLHWHWHLALPSRVRQRPLHLRLPARRSFPEGLRPHYGLAYWALARPAAEYVTRFASERPDVVRYFRHVAVPDEGLFHSVLGSSELADTIERGGLHFVDWARPARVSSPRTFTSPDFERLAASGCPFARKFDMEVDAAVLDRIDHELLGVR